MKLDFEYGQGLMSAELPDNTDVFIPGTTVPDPQCLPQDWDTLYNETLKSIRNPMGMPALKELAAPARPLSSSFLTSSRAAARPLPTGRFPSVHVSTSCMPAVSARKTSCCCSPTVCTPCHRG